MLLTTLPARPVTTTAFDRRFDRAFAQLAGLAFGAGSFARQNSPAVSATWTDGTYVLTVDVPGVPEEALSVSVAGRTLIVDVATDNLTWNERIRLPQTLDVEATTANYANGRLTVTVPGAPQAQPRTVEIVAGARAAAEISAADDQATDNPSNDTE
jgi:HSP20 family molecular chaperone IbpA